MVRLQVYKSTSDLTVLGKLDSREFCRFDSLLVSQRVDGV